MSQKVKKPCPAMGRCHIRSHTRPHRVLRCAKVETLHNAASTAAAPAVPPNAITAVTRRAWGDAAALAQPVMGEGRGCCERPGQQREPGCPAPGAQHRGQRQRRKPPARQPTRAAASPDVADPDQGPECGYRRERIAVGVDPLPGAGGVGPEVGSQHHEQHARDDGRAAHQAQGGPQVVGVE